MARVLVIEDVFVVAQMIADIVEAAGHEVIGTAPHAEAALEAARRSKPDLVILDLQLARGDVAEDLARRLTALTGASIMICSAAAEWVLRHAEEAVRPCAIVRKPVDLEELRAAVEKCLGIPKGERASAAA